jgi:hypothetical protein
MRYRFKHFCMRMLLNITDRKTLLHFLLFRAWLLSALPPHSAVFCCEEYREPLDILM